MTFIRKLKNGKSQVAKDLAFCTLLDNSFPQETDSLKAVIDQIGVRVQSQDSSITKDALNNARGDWYEWLLAFSAWNYFAENKNANLALLTPNKIQFDVAELYDEKLYNLINDLRAKVLESSSVQLISSNPDFVIIDSKLANKLYPSIEKITKIDEQAISTIETAYRIFKGYCGFDDIAGYVSVKLSFRPDRRLQIPHEGSLMKAIYTHLQTREWIISPKGLKYFAIATKVGARDRAALKTVATHSITTVHSIPQAAVDEVFEVDSLEQAQTAFAEILKA
jgi:hypothetical protein